MKWWPKWLRLPEPEPPEALHEAEAAQVRAEKVLEEARKQARKTDKVVREVQSLQNGDRFSQAMETLFRGGRA